MLTLLHTALQCKTLWVSVSFIATANALLYRRRLGLAAEASPDDDVSQRIDSGVALFARRPGFGFRSGSLIIYLILLQKPFRLLKNT